jgi:hypothetical protein
MRHEKPGIVADAFLELERRLPEILTVELKTSFIRDTVEASGI